LRHQLAAKTPRDCGPVPIIGYGQHPEMSTKSADLRNNREINREFFDFLPKIIELCPNYAILLLEQGINREFLNLTPSRSIPRG
jgi:hypothetical protein